LDPAGYHKCVSRWSKNRGLGPPDLPPVAAPPAHVGCRCCQADHGDPGGHVAALTVGSHVRRMQHPRSAVAWFNTSSDELRVGGNALAYAPTVLGGQRRRPDRPRDRTSPRGVRPPTQERQERRAFSGSLPLRSVTSADWAQPDYALNTVAGSRRAILRMAKTAPPSAIRIVSAKKPALKAGL